MVSDDFQESEDKEGVETYERYQLLREEWMRENGLVDRGIFFPIKRAFARAAFGNLNQRLLKAVAEGDYGEFRFMRECGAELYEVAERAVQTAVRHEQHVMVGNLLSAGVPDRHVRKNASYKPEEYKRLLRGGKIIP